MVIRAIYGLELTMETRLVSNVQAFVCLSLLTPLYLELLELDWLAGELLGSTCFYPHACPWAWIWYGCWGIWTQVLVLEMKALSISPALKGYFNNESRLTDFRAFRPLEKKILMFSVQIRKLLWLAVSFKMPIREIDVTATASHQPLASLLLCHNRPVWNRNRRDACYWAPSINFQHAVFSLFKR